MLNFHFQFTVLLSVHRFTFTFSLLVHFHFLLTFSASIDPPLLTGVAWPDSWDQCLGQGPALKRWFYGQVYLDLTSISFECFIRMFSTNIEFSHMYVWRCSVDLHEMEREVTWWIYSDICIFNLFDIHVLIFLDSNSFDIFWLVCFDISWFISSDISWFFFPYFINFDIPRFTSFNISCFLCCCKVTHKISPLLECFDISWGFF